MVFAGLGVLLSLWTFMLRTGELMSDSVANLANKMQPQVVYPPEFWQKAYGPRGLEIPQPSVIEKEKEYISGGYQDHADGTPWWQTPKTQPSQPMVVWEYKNSPCPNCGSTR